MCYCLVKVHNRGRYGHIKQIDAEQIIFKGAVVNETHSGSLHLNI